MRLAVVDVIAFRGLHFFFEVGDAGFNEYIIPGDELLDVAGMYAVAVPLGENLREIVLKFLAGGLLGIDGGFLAFLECLEVLQDIHQGDVVGLGEHGDVGQRRDAVGGEGGHAAVRLVKRLGDQVVLAP